MRPNLAADICCGAREVVSYGRGAKRLDALRVTQQSHVELLRVGAALRHISCAYMSSDRLQVLRPVLEEGIDEEAVLGGSPVA